MLENNGLEKNGAAVRSAVGPVGTVDVRYYYYYYYYYY
jgi:hypothetical protein